MRLHASGVCRSDWSTVTGDTPSPLPAVLGHEGAGVVERVGPGVDSVEPGDHVVLSWLPYCGRCPHCTSGRLTLCDVAAPALLAGTLLDGTTRLSLDGRPVHHYSFLSTFADRTVVPEASCVRIRRDAPLRVAALVGCAIATGVGAVVNRARGLRPDPRSPCSAPEASGLSADAGRACSREPAPSSPSTRRPHGEPSRSTLALPTRSTPATATPRRPCVS